jgi:hypothetical protein
MQAGRSFYFWTWHTRYTEVSWANKGMMSVPLSGFANGNPNMTGIALALIKT